MSKSYFKEGNMKIVAIKLPKFLSNLLKLFKKSK
ncbi:stage V sporulation protein SpoVM [Clostridium sp. MSJ-4]|uniref:Stage V sporulation protein SpoVM n=1 Tax=Clostridium simiarum TaxID=2841506 RepID=A0ABS6EXB2_9CLOT|nr:stage V sporulation protein SpoVM [Clostridium simiarum]